MVFHGRGNCDRLQPARCNRLSRWQGSGSNFLRQVCYSTSLTRATLTQNPACRICRYDRAPGFPPDIVARVGQHQTGSTPTDLVSCAALTAAGKKKAGAQPAFVLEICKLSFPCQKNVSIPPAGLPVLVSVWAEDVSNGVSPHHHQSAFPIVPQPNVSAAREVKAWSRWLPGRA